MASGDEAGTITDGTDTLSFSEIENVFTGSGDDSIDARADSAGLGLFGGSGSDTFQGGRITQDSDSILFSQIERLVLTDYDDELDARDDSAGIDIDLGAGNDLHHGRRWK